MVSTRPLIRFGEIVENIDRIESFARELDRQTFDADLKTVLAVERCLSIISEAAVNLGPDAERLAPGVPWEDIRGIGNHLRHGYDRLDGDTLWATIRRDLKPLRHACQ